MPKKNDPHAALREWSEQVTKTKKTSDEEKALVALGCLLATVAVTIKLAFLALVAWGIFELVTWVTSK